MSLLDKGITLFNLHVNRLTVNMQLGTNTEEAYTVCGFNVKLNHIIILHS